MTLRLDWCDHDAAKYACVHWHYSESTPTPPVVRIGVWEREQFVGVVLFSRGNSVHIGAPYDLDKTEVCELTRVALTTHDATVSQIVSRAIHMLKVQSPGVRLLVSFADPARGHHGGIYQAMNWTYEGTNSPTKMYRDKAGRVWHSRQVSERGYNKQYGQYRACPKPSECETINMPGKHKYSHPLDKRMRRQLAKISKPYPVRTP